MQSEQYFSRKQRALCPGKRAFFVSSENLGWPWPPCPPPRSYAPVRIGNTDMIGNLYIDENMRIYEHENLYIDAIMPMQILMVELILKKMTQYI